MKILYFYCGEGLGHTTRTIAAGKELEKKHKVVYASYGYAQEFGKKNGLNVITVPSEISLVGKGGKFSLSRSILKTVRHANPTAILKYRSLIKKEAPDLVISDSFIVPAILARRKKIPIWMVLNQNSLYKFFKLHKNPLLKLAGKLVERFGQGSLEKMDKILVIDFAPPYTVCADALSFTKKMQNKVSYIGPLVRKECKNEKNFGKNIKNQNTPKNKRVYSSIGGFGYRKILLGTIVETAKMLPEYNFDLAAGPNAVINNRSKNLKSHGNLTYPFPIMSKSSVIISGGGHSQIMEALSLGIPIISAPDLGHYEQESNANGLERLGLGKRISYTTPAEEIAKLIKLLSESKEYSKRLEKISALAKKQNARIEIARLASELEKSIITKSRTNMKKWDRGSAVALPL
ncbi:MAG: glycosyltransferase [Candidatus Diapherotrites archaeon]|nr:glycosyltransferase [Candidatus Diapherotrites archaeon]